MIGSRMGRERLPTAIVAQQLTTRSTMVYNSRVEEQVILTRHPGCSSSPDRSLTVAVLNRRQEPPVDAQRSATSDPPSDDHDHDNSSYFGDMTLASRLRPSLKAFSPCRSQD